MSLVPKKFISRYSPGYLKTLAYMLQSSEYDVFDYLKWLSRVRDFRTVAHRKDLDKTAKARLILATLRTMAFAGAVLYAWLAYLAVGQGLLIGVAGSLAVFLIWPWLIAYLIIIPLYIGELLIQRPQVKKMTAQAREIFKQHPGKIIAVAGSYGKTTMKENLRTVLEQKFNVTSTPGNINTVIGISRFARKLTGKEDAVIIEFGEYRPGDIGEFCNLVHPKIGIITGVNEAHLEKFKTLETTADNIFTLLDYLGDNPVYINGENEIAAARGKDLPLYSRKGLKDWKVSKVSTGLDGTSFTATKDKTTIKAKTKLLGRHQIGPLLAAADVAHELGMSPKQIEKGIQSIEPYPGRLEPQKRPGNVVVLNDSYNGNPDGVRSVIEFLKEIEAKRRIYVTPGLVEMGPRTEEVHTEIGRQLAEGIDVVVLMNNSVTPYITAGLEEYKFNGKLKTVDDPVKFYNSLDQFTKAGDVVLIQNDWPDNYA